MLKAETKDVDTTQTTAIVLIIFDYFVLLIMSNGQLICLNSSNIYKLYYFKRSS